jgi:hypothetical protein
VQRALRTRLGRSVAILGVPGSALDRDDPEHLVDQVDVVRDAVDLFWLRGDGIKLGARYALKRRNGMLVTYSNPLIETEFIRAPGNVPGFSWVYLMEVELIQNELPEVIGARGRETHLVASSGSMVTTTIQED